MEGTLAGMKRVLKIVGLTALLLVVTAWAVGTWALPPDHVASVRAAYGRPAPEVWALISDLEAWSDWNPEVDRMERRTDRDDMPLWVMFSTWGEMPLLIEAFEPPTRLVTLIPADANIGYVGTWTYEVAPTADGGSTLTLTEAGTVENPFFRFLMALSGPYGAMEAMLESVGNHFGETLELERIYDVEGEGQDEDAQG